MFPFRSKKIEMGFTGDSQVLENIVTKVQLLRSGNIQNAKKIRTVVVLPGGGQRGVLQTGAALAFEKLNLTDGIDAIVGVSSGAGVAIYWLGGEAATGARIAVDDLIKNHFVSYMHPWRIMNIEVLERILRSIRPVNLDHFRRQRTKLLIGVTDYNTGKEKYIDVKKMKDPIDAIIASVSIPVFAKNLVTIEKHVYIDGGPGSPLPISYAFEKFKATDVLVIQTRTLDYKPTYPRLFALMLRFTAYRFLSKGVRDDLIHYDKRYNSEMAYIMGDKPVPDGVRLATIYPKVMPIRKASKNSKLLKKVLFESEEFVLNLLKNINR